MSKKVRPRTERRVAERAAQDLVRDRDRLAKLETGGTSDHPIIVASPVLVEPRAAALGCVQCGGQLEVKEHEAKVTLEGRRRFVTAKCRACGWPRFVWFAIEAPLEN